MHQLYTLFFSSCLGLVIELRKMARLQVERRLRLCDPEVATANSSWELAVGSSSKGKPTVTRAMAVGTPHRQMKPLSMYNEFKVHVGGGTRFEPHQHEHA